MLNSITTDTGLDAGHTMVAEELDGLGWMMVSWLKSEMDVSVRAEQEIASLIIVEGNGESEVVGGRE
ncbi:MAG TPA: hypothetical protein VNA15_00645 [Candidatus Angelobacter sp.]|nr:hypothetical protein [Candidatus Angelobacter sp.]